MTASSALPSQMMSGRRPFDDNNADPASITGILRDTLNGELKRDSVGASACESKLELDKDGLRVFSGYAIRSNK